MQTSEKILAVWQQPFSMGAPEIEAWDANMTVAQIITRMPSLPEDFTSQGVVMVGDYEVPRHLWVHVRPKPFTPTSQVAMTLHYAPQGGGGEGGGKKIFALVAAIALSVLTAGVASGSLATASGLFAAGTTSAKILAATISVVGSLIIGALTAPPTTGPNQDDSGGDTAKNPASAQGNVLQQNASIPCVLGGRRIYPPFVIEPLIELVGQDEIVTACCGLAGPHALSNIRIGDASVDEGSNVTRNIDIYTRTALPGDDAPIPILNRQSKTINHGTELSTHVVDPEKQDRLDGASAGNLPAWHGMVSRFAPDEVWIHLNIRALLRQQDEADMRIPFRVRIRRQGTSTWRNLPELHYSGYTQTARRMQIKLVWLETPETPASVPYQNSWVAAFAETNDVSDYEADTYFTNNTNKPAYLSNANVNDTSVRNMVIKDSEAIFYLDPDSWEPGQYEIEIKRGAVVVNSSWKDSTYEYGSTSLDLFGVRDTNLIPMTRKGVADTVNATRLVNIWNEQPINERNMALIAVQAQNVSVDRISVFAEGYTYKPNTTGNRNWNNFGKSNNPAAHYRQILTGALNFNPLPEALIGDDELVEWYDACEDANYTCDMVVEGQPIMQLLSIVASCGYARPYQSDIWTVVRDYDRSAESPVQLFTPRNTKDLTWAKAFPRLPVGLRVNYDNELTDFSEDQVVVYRPGKFGASAQLEQTKYIGFVDRDKVMQRAEFDLRQIRSRATFYSFTAPVEWIRCRKGSLVGLEYDFLGKVWTQGRITDLIYNGNGLKRIEVDVSYTVPSFEPLDDVADLNLVDDVLTQGQKYGIAIRRNDGSVVVWRIRPTGDRDTNIISLWTAKDNTETVQGPYDTDPVTLVSEGCLFAVGELDQVYKRMLVSNIQPARNLEAEITLVDEAPELWS